MIADVDGSLGDANIGVSAFQSTVATSANARACRDVVSLVASVTLRLSVKSGLESLESQRRTG